MRSVTVRTADLKNIIINLGFVGENEHRQIRFDAKKDFEEYPNASASLTVVPPEGESYPAIIERDGDYVLWTITDSDVIGEGDGEIQLAFTEGEVVKRTCIARTKTDRSLVQTGSIPSGIDDFITRAGTLLEQVEETFPAGGTTGQVLAKKSDTDYDTEWVDQSGGTEDYDELENRPQIGGVTLTGNKTLHELGAASEGDVDAKYTKPAGGIPAGDIADGVIPDPEDLIDDTAGKGDTDKVWSADKSHSLLTEINSKTDELKSTIKTITENEVASFTLNKYIATNGSTANISTLVSNTDFAYAVLDCSEGDIFTITGKGGSTPRLYAFLGDESNGSRPVIENASDNAAVTNQYIVAPENAKKLVVNVKKNNTYLLIVGKHIVNAWDDIESNQKAIDDIEGFKEHGYISGSYSGTRFTKVEKKFSRGKYHITIDNVTSSDTDKTTCRIEFGSVGTQVERGVPIDTYVNLESDEADLFLYASSTYALSVNDTFTYTNLKVTKCYDLYDEIKSIEKDVNDVESGLGTLESIIGNSDMGTTATSVKGAIAEHESDIVGIENGKVNKPSLSPNGTSGQLLRTNGDGTTTWVDDGLPTDSQTATAVTTWLNAHPEATTTVQDGSITEAKLSNALKPYVIKDYTTPEMFGAVGDGTTDDTTAITQAFATNKTVIFSKGKTYKFCGTIEFVRNGENTRHLLFANYGKIVYNGISYPFILTGCEYFDIILGSVVIDAGEGVMLIRNGSTQHTVYGVIDFDTLYAPSDKPCIVCDLNNSARRYVNEIKFNGGKFTHGKSAIKFIDDATEGGAYNAYRFFQCGFEGISYIAELPQKESSFEFVECRLEESVNSFATYSNDFANAEQVYCYVSWFGNSTLSFFSGLKNIMVRFYGKYSYGNYIVPGELFYINDVVYFNGVNNSVQRSISNRSVLETIKGISREKLSRFLSTEAVSTGTVSIVLDVQAFTPNVKTSNNEEYYWNAREFPFNTFIIYCNLGSEGTINFINSNGDVLYTVSGADKYLKISYSYYGNVFYFEELNIHRVLDPAENDVT